MNRSFAEINVDIPSCNAWNDRFDVYGDIEQLGLSSKQVVVEVANTFIYFSGKSRAQAL